MGALLLSQALKAGADEALMLDPQGFVATCNSTNFFCVRKGEVSMQCMRVGLGHPGGCGRQAGG